MFTSQDVIEAMVVGLALGGTAAFVAALVLIADPLRRDREELRRRMIQWQLRSYAAESRLSAHKMLRSAEAREPDTFSRKVTDLTVVR